MTMGRACLLGAVVSCVAPSPSFGQASAAPIGPVAETYFPSNGALLWAVGLMAGGWDGAPRTDAHPGFPNDGRWVVRSEGLRPLP